MINRINTILAVLLVAIVVMTATIGVDYSQPNIEILPDMKYTLAWEAFAANPNFPNGQTMQAPVTGTIARGHMPLHYAATKEDAVRAGEELQNPASLAAIEAAVAVEHDEAPADEASLAADAARQNEIARRAAMVRERVAASVERGGEVYRTFCISCHGPKGAGDGLVTQRGFPPPPSMLTGKSLQMKDGQLFHILTYGQGSMASFAAQLSRERRWDVINYVRDLQSTAPPPPEAPPADANATVVPDSSPAPIEEAKPTFEKSAEADEVNSEKAEPESPRNQLRDRSPDKDSSASPDLKLEDKVPQGLPTNDANRREAEAALE